jgi:hypothetical protein
MFRPLVFTQNPLELKFSRRKALGSSFRDGDTSDDTSDDGYDSNSTGGGDGSSNDDTSAPPPYKRRKTLGTYWW